MVNFMALSAVKMPQMNIQIIKILFVRAIDSESQIVYGHAGVIDAYKQKILFFYITYFVS